MIGGEELTDISSYQMLPADKNSKRYFAHPRLVKKAGSYMSHFVAVKLLIT
jgi:hypothetical protein